jgi:site-specific recombinase XerD
MTRRTEEESILDAERVAGFAEQLREGELAAKSVTDYVATARDLAGYLNGKALNREKLERYREEIGQRVSVSRANSMIAGVNRLLEYLGREELRLRQIKADRGGAKGRRELTGEDITRMLRAARENGKERGELLLRTIFATGVKVSEVVYITVEAAREGKSVIAKKEKRREIVIPDALCGMILGYAERENIESGPVFLSRRRIPLVRQDIYREIKTIAGLAEIDCEAYPQQLRKLFGRAYYNAYPNPWETAQALGNKTAATALVYAPRPAESDRRENLNELFKTAQGKR